MISESDNDPDATELSVRTRALNLERMGREVFDIAVIGGGITGAGVSLDAASRGLTVALVEKRDFASGTSSRSSKLIHGGLRYLEQFDFGLVRESLHERAVLTSIAPHLSRPLQFMVPVYSSGDRSPLGASRLRLEAGLWLYDLLAGRQNIGRHRWLTPTAALTYAPAIDPTGLRGAFLYYDCLTDDARLVIEVIKAAAARGALVANYVRAESVRKEVDGLSRISIVDALEHQQFELRARSVVNAAGVWSDEVSRLSDAQARKRLRPSKGIHIVVPSEKFKNRAAVLIPSLGEDRFLFVIPWQGRTLIGTTDTDYSGSLDEPHAEADEIERVVRSASLAFPESDLSTGDVISSFAGLRPLIAAADGESTNELSRKEEIFDDQSGMITITGGKLTTWRRMAERVVDHVIGLLETVRDNRRMTNRHSITENIRLARRPDDTDGLEAASIAATKFGLRVASVEHLMDAYGGNYRAVLELTRESEELKLALCEGLPHIAAEVVYAARYEMVAKVEDFLSRRSRIELLACDHGRSCSAFVERLIEREVGKTRNR